jgi:hypothetical protein
VTARQRLVIWAIAVLAGAQCIYWLVGAALLYALRGLMVGDNSPQAAIQARNAALVFLWFAINAGSLALYLLRRRPGRVLLAGVQLGNLGYGLWLTVETVSSSCFQDSSIGLLLQPAAAAGALVLLYVDWRGSAFARPRSVRGLAISLALAGLGVGLVIYGWYFGINGITPHSGSIVSIAQGGYGVTITLDSVAKPMYFDSANYPALPALSQGQHVVVLTADSPQCGYGAPMAIEVSGNTYIDQIYGGDLAGYTPATWSTHEAIRIATLVGGFALLAVGVALLFRWVS